MPEYKKHEGIFMSHIYGGLVFRRLESWTLHFLHLYMWVIQCPGLATKIRQRGALKTVSETSEFGMFMKCHMTC